MNNCASYRLRQVLYPLVSIFLVMAFVVGCERFPADANRSLSNIKKSGVLKVGLVEEPPWVLREGSVPSGSEVQLVEKFAEHLGVKPESVFLSESRAVEMLKNYELDIAIGGFTKNNPRSEIGVTRAYLITGKGDQNRHVFFVPQGENALLVALERFLGTSDSSGSRKGLAN